VEYLGKRELRYSPAYRLPNALFAAPEITTVSNPKIKSNLQATQLPDPVSYRYINQYEMKKHLSVLLCMLFSIALLQSCRKDYAHENYTEEKDPVIPDLTVKSQVSIAGFVTNENGGPVSNAEVAAGNKTAITDKFGYFQITDVSLPEIAGFIKVKKSSYFTGYKTFLAEQGKESFVRIKLLPQNNKATIDAVSGGSADLPGGARLTLPPAAVVIASSGSAYAGAINVSAHFIDPTNVQDSRLQSPGDGRGINEKGHLQLLNSYGILAIELTGNSGQLLQIAPGRQATMVLPIPSSMAGSAPASIALWSFDETNGLWKHEGTATKSGNSYTGSAAHFSFWTGAVGIPLVQFTAQIVNQSLQPVGNAAIGIRGENEPFNAGYGRFGYTDANGYVTGTIPANRQLLLNVLTPCETEAYSHPFNSGSTDIDLGTLTGNLGQGMVTINGNVVDCSNQPVNNGYVQTYDNGFYNRINFANGVFSFTGLACTNAVVSYVAIDNNTNQQSAPQSISLVPGLNNLGTITSCDTNPLSSVAITIDGVTTTIAEPADQFLNVFIAASGGSTAIVKTNNPPFNFQFDGPASITGSHKVTEIFSDLFPGGRAIAPVPLTVTITQYDLPGGFISGNFSGMMLDFPANGVHNVSCNFRVKRFQ
jgi:hypothetical protein